MDAHEAKKLTLQARLAPHLEEYNQVKNMIQLYAGRGQSVIKLQNLSLQVVEQLKHEGYKVTRFTGEYLWTIEW